MRLFCCPVSAPPFPATGSHASVAARHAIVDAAYRTSDAHIRPASCAGSIASGFIPASNGDDSTATAPESPSTHQPVASRDDGVAHHARDLAGDIAPLVRHARALARESPRLARHVTELAFQPVPLACESP